MVPIDSLELIVKQLIIDIQLLLSQIRLSLLFYLHPHHNISGHQIRNNLALLEELLHDLLDVPFRNIEAQHVVLDLRQLQMDHSRHLLQVLLTNVELLDTLVPRKLSLFKHGLIGPHLVEPLLFDLLDVLLLFVVLDDIELDELRDHTLPEPDILPDVFLLDQLEQVVLLARQAGFLHLDEEGRCQHVAVYWDAGVNAVVVLVEDDCQQFSKTEHGGLIDNLLEPLYSKLVEQMNE